MVSEKVRYDTFMRTVKLKRPKCEVLDGGVASVRFSNEESTDLFDSVSFDVV